MYLLFPFGVYAALGRHLGRWLTTLEGLRISFSAFGNGTFTESDCSTQRRTRYERVFDKSIPAEAERCSLAGVISMSEFNATQG
jgi:hypothetical protein